MERGSQETAGYLDLNSMFSMVTRWFGELIPLKKIMVPIQFIPICRLVELIRRGFVNYATRKLFMHCNLGMKWPYPPCKGMGEIAPSMPA